MSTNGMSNEAHKKASPELLKRQLEFQVRLNAVIQRIQESASFRDVMPEIEEDMLSLLNAERITIYQRSRTAPALVSKYKSGDEIKEIRVALSPSSIAGYVGLNQQPVRIADVYNAEALTNIHPNLRFDKSYDLKSGFRTQSMIVVPIKSKDVLFGVIQVLICCGGGVFFVFVLCFLFLLGFFFGFFFCFVFGGLLVLF